MNTASPSLLSIMRRDACVRIKSKIVRVKRVIVKNEYCVTLITEYYAQGCVCENKK